MYLFSASFDGAGPSPADRRYQLSAQQSRLKFFSASGEAIFTLMCCMSNDKKKCISLFRSQVLMIYWPLKESPQLFLSFSSSSSSSSEKGIE